MVSRFRIIAGSEKITLKPQAMPMRTPGFFPSIETEREEEEEEEEEEDE